MRKASHDGCRDRCRCCCILTFFYIRLTNHLLNLARHTFLLITTNGQASADTDKIRYSTRPNAISASLYTVNKTSSSKVYLTSIHLFNIFCWLTLMTQIIRNAVNLRWKVCIWYCIIFSFHPPVCSLKPYPTVFTWDTLHDIEIWTTVCEFENWELIAYCRRTEEVERVRERALLSARFCLSCLHFRPRIGTPGKNGTSGHPVPNPKIQVQITSLSFGSLSVHCSCHTETRFKRPLSNDRNAHFERQYS